MTPRPLRSDSSPVTLAHLYDAIKAGVGPIRQEVSELRREVRVVADDITALRVQRGRLRRWVSQNLGTAAVNGTAGIVIAAASAAATYLLTHL